MFNNSTTATCPQNVPVKKFWKSVNIWRRYGQSQSGTFFWDTVYIYITEKIKLNCLKLWVLLTAIAQLSRIKH